MAIALLLLWLLCGFLNLLVWKKNKVDVLYWKIQWLLTWIVLITQLLGKLVG